MSMYFNMLNVEIFYSMNLDRIKNVKKKNQSYSKDEGNYFNQRIRKQMKTKN